jgi:hypothetical protein
MHALVTLILQDKMEYVFKVFSCEVNIAEQIYCNHVLKLHLEDKHLCFAVCVNLKPFFWVSVGKR